MKYMGRIIRGYRLPCGIRTFKEHKFKELVFKGPTFDTPAFRVNPKVPLPDSLKHCGYCGCVRTHWVKKDLAYLPLECNECGKETYCNPVPVAVSIIPVDKDNGEKGILLTRRNIAPHIGGLCLPGGFMNWSESLTDTMSRELWEETGVELSPREFEHFETLSTPEGTRVLIFGVAKWNRAESYIRDKIKHYKKTKETSEILIGGNAAELCFPLHQQVYNRWFAEHRK